MRRSNTRQVWRCPSGRTATRPSRRPVGAADAHRVRVHACRAATSTRRARCTATGVMRLATARDELVPLRDDRVRENPAYLTVVLLARVVTRIGDHRRRPRRDHREPVRLGPGVPAGPVPPDQPGGPHPRGGAPARTASTSSRSTSSRWAPGGIVTYATDRLYEEVAYVAYHFHWSLDELLDLEHADRQRYVAEIARINTRITTGR